MLGQHGPCWSSGKRGFWRVVPRPSDTGRVGQHGGPCQTPDFCMGWDFGSSTGRVGLHGPCQPLMFEFLKNCFDRIFRTVTPIYSPFEAVGSL